MGSLLQLAGVLLPISLLLIFTFNLLRVIEHDPLRAAREELHFLPPTPEGAAINDDDHEVIFEEIGESPGKSPTLFDDENDVTATTNDVAFEFLPELEEVEADLPELEEVEVDRNTDLEQIQSETVTYLPDYVDVESHVRFKDFIGSPESTTLDLRRKKGDGDCFCQLLSIDCLDTISCISHRHQTASGVAVRNFLRRHALFWKHSIDALGGSPIGMSTQFTTVGVFREWLSNNQLPRGLPNSKDAFLNATHYDYCVENNLRGRNCFIHDFTQFEEEDDDSEGISTGRSSNRMIRQLLELQKNPLWASPLIYLLAYCHISRITFQLRPFVLDLYQSHLKQVTPKYDIDPAAIPFKVGLHVRRGDSCGHKKGGYESKASELNSIPQVSHHRKCYEAEVYLKALRKIQEKLQKHEKDYQLVVYVATDHSSSLLKEIQEADPNLYASTTWTYLEYSRDLFDYLPKDLDPLAYFIESPENPNKGILGESAILDIHHLSHGVDAFVGHLGSRFGKLGWYQAISVRNGFVPYYTVDGHSTCCEIDENCGKMAEDGAVLSMENCIGLFYPQIDRFRNNQTETDYWVASIGATHRKLAAKAERIWRQNRTDEESSGIANIQWTNLNVNAATWDYYKEHDLRTKKEKRRKKPNYSLEEEPEYFRSSKRCRKFMEQDIPTSLPVLPQRSSTNGACDGYKGILHIRHGDVGGASGTVFFQFMIGQLLWAEQHNYKPWVHMNDISRVVYDDTVHGDPNEGVNFTMLSGMKIGWARDPKDPLGYTFPGVPCKENDVLRPKQFDLTGTGIWNHYFYPVSDFNPNDLNDVSCQNKPLVTMDYSHIVPGLHSHAPWVPHPWRYWMPEYIQRPKIPMKIWLDDQRNRATTVVQEYIHFTPYLKQRALCAHPSSASKTPTLGMHIRHGDKFPSRERIPLEKFLPYTKAFINAHPKGTIYLATDSALVYQEIQQSWGDIASKVRVQPAVQGLSSNDTAAFDLGVSKHRTNTEALTDILALSRCTFLLHGWSAITEAVFFLNPKLIDHAVDLEMDYELEITEKKADAAKQAYFNYLLGGKMSPLLKKLKLEQK